MATRAKGKWSGSLASPTQSAPAIADLAPMAGALTNLRCLYLEIVTHPSSVACARLCTRTTLAAWGIANVLDDAELVVSELVTNAVNATLDNPGVENVALYLAADEKRVFMLVWDGGDDEPQPKSHDDEAVGGRGLQIVDALTDRWGSCKADHGGKVVWVILNSRDKAGC